MRRVTRKELKSEFSDLDQYFDKYCDRYPEYDKLKMIAELLNGSAVLWRWDSGFILGKPNKYHNKDTFLLEAMAGENYLEMLEALHIVEDEIKQWGFDTIELYGRKGWTKYAKPLGYKQEFVVMRKDLGDTDGI